MIIHIRTLSSGHYWSMWEDLTDELHNEYLTRNTLPQKSIRVNSISINQLDPLTGQVVKMHSSVQDVINKFRVSRTSLKDAIDHNYTFKGYKWANVKAN